VLFAFITLALAGHLTNTTLQLLGVYYQFAALAIATSVLTLLIGPTFLVVDLMRTGAVTSLVCVELGVLSFLWVLWLSVGADAADVNSRVFPTGCGFISERIDTACREFSAIVAFGFLTWIILFAYTIVLLVYAIIGSSRGHKVWTSSVKQTDFLAPSGAQTGGFHPEPVMQQGQLPQASTSPSPIYTTAPPQGYAGYPNTTPSPQHTSPYPQV